MLFNDWGSTVTMLLWVIGLSWLIGFVCWGVQPMVRQQRKRSIRRSEQVRFSSEVNTDLIAYQVRRNHANIALAMFLMLVLVIWRPLDVLVVLGGFVLGVYLMRDHYLQRPFQMLQGFILSNKGVHLFPERQGQLLWEGKHHKFFSWDRFNGYRIDGSYVQFLDREGNLVVQIEYAPNEFEAVKSALFDLRIKRLEPSDRIWVAQLDEQEFYEFEDEICKTGWELIELFLEELEELNLAPEFGIMRNMPGDRLLEEHARSWLQLNLINEVGERKASASFSLWQSNGNIGFLVGPRGQDLIDKLQVWIKKVLHEAKQATEEVVS